MSGVLIVRQSLADMPPGDEWLTPWEAGYAESRRVPKRREEWRLGRWTAKGAVCEWSGIGNPGDIEIRQRPDGAPEAFVRGGPGDCAISLSHSNGRAVCAVVARGTAIGCDIEMIEPRDRSFADDYFTADECKFVRAAPEDARALATTLIWSAKECALKAIGEGLRLDTREVEVVTDGISLDVAELSWRRLEVVRFSPHTSYTGWWRLDSPFVVTFVTAGASFDTPRETRHGP